MSRQLTQDPLASLPLVSRELPSPAAPPRPKTFVHHAKLISALTLASRFLGMARESLAARYFGAGLVSSAFSVAFTIPNLFRRLFGEGALSVAFIPLYAQTLKTQPAEESRKFAAAAVNMLALILLAITLVGEGVLWAISRSSHLASDHLLAIRLTAVMLPYVLLVCGAAFLGAILQVHRRFGLTAASSIILNLGLIGGTVAGAFLWDLKTDAGQIRAVYLVSALVLVAGVLQILILLPSLRAVGFQFDLAAGIWTPAVRKMLRLSIPVGLGAAVLQLSTVLDKGLAFLLAQRILPDGSHITHFSVFGHVIKYPLAYGAAARLTWAQFLYQFPLAIFATALATAIFPSLSADAMEADREKFKAGLRQGLRVTLWEGLPASLGLILVAEPCVRLLFQWGNFKSADTLWVTRSVQFYAIAIWAFSIQQIVSRAYYALHDTLTPLLLAVLTLVINLVVELPLLWTGLGEAGMAVGTTVSFIVQAIIMLYLLDRRVGGLGLGQLRVYSIKLVLATLLMGGVCLALRLAPFFPAGPTRHEALGRLGVLVAGGALAYILACRVMGIGLLGAQRVR